MTRLADDAELVLHLRNQTGESPVWHAGEQALYWVDIPTGTLHRWRPSGQQHTSWRADRPLACIAPLAAGGWIGAMDDGVYRLSLRDDQILEADKLAGVGHARPAMRFNDGCLDRSLRVPVPKVAMCAFGGPGLDTLFVTSIRLPGAAPHALDGAVFALRPGVCGLPEPAYAG